MYQTETLDESFNELTSYVFWSKVGEILNLQGHSKFGDIVKLVKACFSLSHGNAEPERGFSENKRILHGRDALEPDTIVALRAVKNFINLSQGCENIVISRRLLDLCSLARKKYFAYLDAKNDLEKLTLAQKRKEVDSRKKETIRKNLLEKVSEIDTTISIEGSKLASAEVLIEDSNKTLLKVVNSTGKVNKGDLIKAQMLLHAGIDKSAECKSKITNLQKQKANLLKKK